VISAGILARTLRGSAQEARR